MAFDAAATTDAASWAAAAVDRVVSKNAAEAILPMRIPALLIESSKNRNDASLATAAAPTAPAARRLRRHDDTTIRRQRRFLFTAGHDGSAGQVRRYPA